MGLTAKQKMLLHLVPDQLGIDKTARLMIQRTVGEFESAADAAATHEGFVAVMAHYEGRNGGSLNHYTPGYWAAAHAKNQREGGDPQRKRFVILERAADIGWSRSDVEAFLIGPHMADGKVLSLDAASAYWLDRCLTAITAMAARRANTDFLDALDSGPNQETPTPGEIVRRVRRWLEPEHDYSIMFDVGEAARRFLDDCAEQIAQRGEGARFSERQVDYLRGIWKEAVREISQSMAQAKREGAA